MLALFDDEMDGTACDLATIGVASRQREDGDLRVNGRAKAHADTGQSFAVGTAQTAD